MGTSREPADLTAELASSLRTSRSEEYFAILGVISEYDGRFMTIKGWSVTLSLAGLGLGFSQEHYALFALAAASALGFWTIEADAKKHQMRYYRRMRELEVEGDNESRVGFAPRIDWAWVTSLNETIAGAPEEWTGAQMKRLTRRAFWMRWVCVPHIYAVTLGTALFAGYLYSDLAGLGEMRP